jgi:phenylpropionate dioxygenase-like ring-hydroxylating dioxygenase large terminal subunit
MPDLDATDGSSSAALGGALATDAAFAADVARHLLPSWQFVCHESDLPAPGTAMRFDFCGRSALLLRRPDAEIVGFANACRHRGSRLVDGDAATGLAFCIDGKIRCPVHGWVYSADGLLDHLPRADSYADLDRRTVTLEPLGVRRIGPWVFVAFVDSGRDDRSAVGDAWLKRFEPARTHPLRRFAEPRVRDLDANWRLVCADVLDWPALGSQALALPLDRSSLEIEAGEQAVSMSAQLQTAATTWSARRYLGYLTSAADPATARWHGVFAWPNLSIEVGADQWTITQVLPVSPRRTLLREVCYGFPDASQRMRVVRYLHGRLRRRHAAGRARRLGRLQAGLQTSGVPPGPFAGDELGLRWFTRRLQGESSPG